MKSLLHSKYRKKKDDKLFLYTILDIKEKNKPDGFVRVYLRILLNCYMVNLDQYLNKKQTIRCFYIRMKRKRHNW